MNALIQIKSCLTGPRLIAGLSVFVAWEVIELIWGKFFKSKTKPPIHEKDSQYGVECDEIVFTFSNYMCTTNHRSGSITCGAEFCPFSVLNKLVNLISSSKSSIHICAYSLSLPDLVDAIIKVHRKRKILVKVIVEDHLDSEGAQKLKKRGIPVLGNTLSKGLMHLKTIVIDEKLLITGSFNFTKTALIGQDNNFIITRNKGVIESALNSFRVLWEANSNPKSTPTK